jgi:hypothetical protein
MIGNKTKVGVDTGVISVYIYFINKTKKAGCSETKTKVGVDKLDDRTYSGSMSRSNKKVTRKMTELNDPARAI